MLTYPADHSLPFAVSMMLLEGSLEIRHFDDAYYTRPEVRAFMAKVRLIAHKRDDMGWHVVPASTVEVKLESGEVLSETVTDPLGHPRNPMTPADVEQKFRSLVTPFLPEPRVMELLSALRDFDDVNDIKDILSLTVRPQGPGPSVGARFPRPI